MMKKVLSITASTLIVAGSVSAPAQAEDVFSRLSVRAAGHYDQATNERGAFATRNTVAAGAAGETFFVEPDYEWDYTLGLEYMLPNSDNSSLVFDYDHYNASDNKRATGPAAFPAAGALLSIIDSATPFGALQADGDLNVKDHTFRLGARRVLDFGDRFDVQLGGYAEYSKVERHHTIIEVNGAASRTFTANQEANGWGPSFDMYGRWYPMGRHSCYSVLAGVEGAFLYGDSVHNARAVDEAGNLVAVLDSLGFEANNSNRADLNHVFTRLGGTVALAYARPVNDSWKFGLRAGARWINYANAFKNASGLSSGRTDYGRWGPFLEVRVGGVDSPM